MNYIKVFLKGFVDGLCILDPKSLPMLILGLVPFLSLAIITFVNSQIIIGILFILNAINIGLNYIWNCYTQRGIILILESIVTIIALIFCIIFICF